jgi:4-hydroxybenzoate polyprenyltransferase
MMEENKKSILQRLWIYQRERFPLIVNLIAVAVFTFSAISYSRICRGEHGFIPIKHYFIGVFVTFTLFLLVRIFDEFKDKIEDALYRKYLPIPRGLVTLSELRTVAILVAILQLGAILVFQPQMIGLQLIVLVYLCLMGVEFFVPNYLKKRQILYITSHMIIFPLIDIYSSGLDWKIEGAEPHYGLLLFFVVSFMNGLVVEFGRKLRAPGYEEENVISYTGLYGTKNGTIYWMLLMTATYLFGIVAAWYAGYGFKGLITLSLLLIFCIVPGFIFLKKLDVKRAKWCELSSALWAVSMYLILGAFPMLAKII